MKILLLTDRMEAGGAETHIAQLARGLQKMGCEVAILSEGGHLAETLSAEGIEQFYAPLSNRKLFHLLRLRRELRRLVQSEGFEVLHAHTRLTAFLLRGIKPGLAARIVTVHARFRTSAWLRRLCFWGDRTIAVSEDLRAYVCDLYNLPAERVTVIPNGIDCARFRPPERREGAPCVLFASRLDRDCALGAALLCEIAPRLCRRFPGLRIEIAGGGDAYSDIYALADRVNRRFGRTVITTLGWVGNMPSRLAQCDVFIGVSRAAMEAAATGCAVILCGNEGYGGMLNRESVGVARLSNFCARGEEMPNAARLEHDLACLIETPALRQAYGAEGREIIERDYNAERMCRETLALYHRAHPMQRKITLTVGGYFGCGNVGDDAILLGFLEGMREIAPGVAVTALSGQPRLDRRRYGVRCVSRKNPISILLAMLGARAFLCGGGSLLQSTTSRRSLSYYLALLSMSRLCGCRTALYAAGIGPLPRNADRLRVLRALQKCDYVGVRDRDSLAYLNQLGVDSARLRLGADPACLLPLPPPGRAEAILSAHRVPKGDYFCLILHRDAPQTLRQNLIAATRIICARTGCIPLLPILDRQDAGLTRRAAGELDGYAISGREPSDVAALISCACATLTLRLHALIFATCVKVPAIGVAAHPDDQKIASFADAAGQDHLPHTRATVPSLVEKIEQAIAARRTRAPLLEDTATEMRRIAKTDLQRIFDLSKENHTTLT